MSKSAVLKMWSAGPTTVLTVNTLLVINVFAFFAVRTFAKAVVAAADATTHLASLKNALHDAGKCINLRKLQDLLCSVWQNGKCG